MTLEVRKMEIDKEKLKCEINGVGCVNDNECIDYWKGEFTICTFLQYHAPDKVRGLDKPERGQALGCDSGSESGLS